MHELNRAISWYLERRPRIYAIEIDPGYFLWVTEQLPYDFPLLRIFYRIDDDTRTVTILSVDHDKPAPENSN